MASALYAGGIHTAVTPVSCRCLASCFSFFQRLPSLGRFHSKYCIMTPFLIIRFFCFLDIPRYGVPRGTARFPFAARGTESFNFHAKRISPLSRSGRVLIIRPLSGRRIVRKRQCVRSVSASGADVSVKEAGSGSVRRHGCTDAECRRKEAACVRSWIELGVARI